MLNIRLLATGRSEDEQRQIETAWLCDAQQDGAVFLWAKRLGQPGSDVQYGSAAFSCDKHICAECNRVFSLDRIVWILAVQGLFQEYPKAVRRKSEVPAYDRGAEKVPEACIASVEGQKGEQILHMQKLPPADKSSAR